MYNSQGMGPMPPNNGQYMTRGGFSEVPRALTTPWVTRTTWAVDLVRDSAG